MHALRTELDPQPPAEREAYLRDHIKPHYGLGLHQDAGAGLCRPSGTWWKKYGIVMRDDYTPFFRACPASRRSGWK